MLVDDKKQNKSSSGLLSYFGLKLAVFRYLKNENIMFRLNAVPEQCDRVVFEVILSCKINFNNCQVIPVQM